MFFLHVRRIFDEPLTWVLSCLWSCFLLKFGKLEFSSAFSSLLCVLLMCFLLYYTFMHWSFLVLLTDNRYWILALLLWRGGLGQYIIVGIWGVWMLYAPHSLMIQLYYMMQADTRYLHFCIRAFSVLEVEDILLSIYNSVFIY